MKLNTAYDTVIIQWKEYVRNIYICIYYKLWVFTRQSTRISITILSVFHAKTLSIRSPLSKLSKTTNIYVHIYSRSIRSDLYKNLSFFFLRACILLKHWFDDDYEGSRYKRTSRTNFIPFLFFSFLFFFVHSRLLSTIQSYKSFRMEEALAWIIQLHTHRSVV